MSRTNQLGYAILAYYRMPIKLEEFLFQMAKLRVERQEALEFCQEEREKGNLFIADGFLYPTQMGWEIIGRRRGLSVKEKGRRKFLMFPIHREYYA